MPADDLPMRQAICGRGIQSPASLAAGRGLPVATPPLPQVHEQTPCVSFDNLVGTGYERKRNCNAKQFCSFSIDDEAKSGWTFHWKFLGFRSFQNLIDVIGSTAKEIR